jgi:hypothetical protein
MLVTISPVVTAGLERGGEDLELEFHGTYCSDTLPKAINKLEWNFDCNGFSHEEDNNGLVKIETDFYEFSWEGKIEDTLDLEIWRNTTVRGKLLDPNSWSYAHKPGEKPRLSCKFRAEIDGNAE